MNTGHINKLPPEIILWGGTGQAKVVRPIIEHFGSRVVAVFDDTVGLPSPFADVPIYIGMAGFLKWKETADITRTGFCIAVGNPHGRFRMALHDKLLKEGLQTISIAHHSAVIEPNATIGWGVQIMAGAIICAEAVVGNECIINTRASVDHEDVLEDGVEIAPGATLCGSIHVGTAAWVGAGATILPRISIGADSIVGAGAVVTVNIPPKTTVVGIPAKPIKKK